MAEVAFCDYLKEIDKLIERGSTEQAMQHCRHILAQHPKAVEIYRLLGKALLEQEDDPAAQDIFQRVLSVDPEDFVARVGLSVIHDRNNELERAIWHMERAFEIAPSNALIQGELRRLYARRDGDSPDARPAAPAKRKRTTPAMHRSLPRQTPGRASLHGTLGFVGELGHSRPASPRGTEGAKDSNSTTCSGNHRPSTRECQA